MQPRRGAVLLFTKNDEEPGCCGELCSTPRQIRPRLHDLPFARLPLPTLHARRSWRRLGAFSTICAYRYALTLIDRSHFRSMSTEGRLSRHGWLSSAARGISGRKRRRSLACRAKSERHSRPLPPPRSSLPSTQRRCTHSGSERSPARVSCPARAKFYSKKAFGSLPSQKRSYFPLLTALLPRTTRRNRFQNPLLFQWFRA
jgi:hypothetical protein